MRRPPGHLVTLAVVTAVTVAASVALAAALVSGWLGNGDRVVHRAPAIAPRFSAAVPPGEAAARPAATPRRSPAMSPASSPATELLRRWDARRARAYARGDPARLRSLYVDGSTAASDDVAILRDYIGRGLHVVGLRMQLLAVDVLDHAPGRWRLRVTDRVHHGAAVHLGNGRIVLPRDEASTRVLTLRRTSAGWKVAAVSRSAQRRAVRRESGPRS